MFKKLVQFLFRSSKEHEPTNYFSFEGEQKTAQERPQVVKTPHNVESKPPVAETLEEKYQKAFYDYLFGETQHNQTQNQQHDEISHYVAEQVEKLLANPKHILKSLPVLPVSLSKILEQLNTSEFDTDLIITLIQEDPLIAAKVIELANSAYYNRSHKDIRDIKAAFMLLGANGLMEGVINGFVSRMAPQKNIYFKQYGAKIWQHSLSTGIIAKALLHKTQYKSDAAEGYLIGLICNLGDMVIYQLLVDSFSFVHPDCQPNSFAFKDLMYKNSKKITYHIAKHWNFPSSILDALAIQAKLTKSSMLGPLFQKRPIAGYIYEANILSELEMKMAEDDVDDTTIEETKNKLLYSDEAKYYVEQLVADKQEQELAKMLS